MTNNPQEKRAGNGKRLAVIIAFIFFLIVAGIVTTEFFLTTRVSEISETKGLDARGGTITITYSRPVDQPLYSPADPSVKTRAVLGKDNLTEVHTLIYPTPYNKSFSLEQSIMVKGFRILGLFAPPEEIGFSTGIEKVAIRGLVPSEKTNPAPDTMNNQLVIQFQGEVRGRYKKGVNISASEMSFVKLSPEVEGYYRWSDDSNLTFNFTGSKPQFETRYSFTVFPEKFINKEYQEWVGGDTTEISLTTSTNEVYVHDFSLNGKVNWRAPLFIEFSGNMVGALDVLKKKSKEMVPVTITPDAGGFFVWVNARVLKFVPDNISGWPVRNTVNVSIRPEINNDPDRKWRNGMKPEQFSFYVLPREQSIRSYSLTGDAVELDTDLVVNFSRKLVKKEMIGKKFTNTVTADNIPFLFTPEIKGSFFWVRQDRVKFRPENLWSELKTYTVNLNPDFNPDKRYDWTGTKEFKFKTVENVVNAQFYMTPENRISPSVFFADKGKYIATGDVQPESRLWILFDKDIGRFVDRKEDLGAHVKITPEIDGKFEWLSNSLLEFVPAENWKEKTGYSVSLTAGLLSHPEQHFAKESGSFSYKTSENIVRIAELKKSDTARKTPGSFKPEKEVEFNFSKNMKTLLKVGKTYSSTEIEPDRLPVQLTPATPFTLFWKTKRTLVLTPVTYWQPETVYTVALNPAILPQTESAFQYGPTSYLKTEKNIVKIDSFNPQGQVGRRVVADVVFSRKIRPKGVKNGDKDTSGLFSLTPSVKGDWIWLSESKIQLKPEAPLETSTEYTVTFYPAKIADKQFTWHIPPAEGESVPAGQEFNFHTAPLHVVSAAARFEFNKTDLLKQKFFLDIELSDYVQEADLKKHFSIWYVKKTDKGEPIEVPLLYTIETTDKRDKKPGLLKSFAVVSDWVDRPAKDRRVDYKIAADLPVEGGNLPLAEDYSGYFYQEKAKYLKINKVAWDMKDRKYYARLLLNAPIEPELLQKGLTIYSVNAETNELRRLEYELSVGSARNRHSFAYDIVADFDPGVKQRFEIQEGLLAADGAFTSDMVSTDVYTPNLNTRLDFALNGSFISMKDLNKVPVITTNRTRFRIKIEKIFANNVAYFLNNCQNKSWVDTVARTTWSKYYDVRSSEHGKDTHNKTIITHIDLSEIVKDNRHGIFRISLDGSSSRRFFISTDIGLIARRFNDRIVVWANSLHGLTPVGGLSLEAIDRWNQVTGKAFTDSSGYAEIVYDKNAPPKFVIAKKGTDFSYIDLSNHKEKLTGYDIEGIPSDKTSVRTYLYSDRGVYRPGDTVHLIAVSRGKEGVLPEHLPVRFTLNNPVGKEILSERYTLDSNGLYVYDFIVPGEAKTGKWKAGVYRDGNLTGSYTFQVEEFIPNKIKVELAMKNKTLRSGDTLQFEVKSRNLFGPPAAGRPVSGAINFRASTFKPAGYSGYNFGNSDIEFKRMDDSLPEVKLNDDGKHIFSYKVPDNIQSPSGLTVNYSAVVIDDSGRGVAAYGSSDVLLYSQYVGIRRTSGKLPEINTPVGFQTVNLYADGKSVDPAAQDLTFRIFKNKKITHYRKNERGYYRYVTEKERVLIAETANPKMIDDKFFFTPESSGEYILEVEDSVGKQRTHYRFRVAGNDRSGVFTEASDRIEMKVLNKNPAVNDLIKVEILSPFAGKLLLTGEQDRVLFSRVIELTENKTTVTIPIEKAHLPNFYLSGIVLKPVSHGSEKEPIYATGLTNVTVYDKSHEPAIHLTAPKRANPNGEFTVSVKIDDTNQEEMFFTIAAVDEGIINLTRFQLPDMTRYFNMKRRLEVEHFSMYPMVMPYEPDVKNIISPSGDEPSRGLIKKKRVNPDSQKRVKSVALWSGLLKTDKNGNGTCTFKVPDFNGSLRIMAVAFGNQRFASAKNDIVIRDNLVMKPSLPRFAATGDDFIIPVTLFNLTGTEGDVTAGIKVSDHIALKGPAEKTLFLAPNQEETIFFTGEVKNEMGLSEFRLYAEGLGEKTLKTINVPVRSPGSFISEYDSGTVDRDTPRTIQMPDTFISNTRQLAMKITANPLVRFQNSLGYLLKYPHGCLEQTTSKLFPLLYFSELATSAGDMFTSEKRPKYFLKKGIAKIERMQLENGAFAYWEGGNRVNLRAFYYAAHFITEARSAGLKVNENVWNNMLYQLNKKVAVSYENQSIYSGSSNIGNTVYGLYVLALAGENVYSKLNYIYEGYFESLKPHDKARLAAAFAASGEKSTAESILSGMAGFEEYDSLYRDTGGDFSSNGRDLAVILDAFVEVVPESSKIRGLTEQLMNLARNGRWGSTQENAFAFLAIGKALTKSKALSTKAKITLGDGSTVPFDREVLLETPELLKGEVRIEVEGDGEVAYVWEAAGIHKKPESLQVDKDIRIRRTFLDKDGNKADLKSIRQGTLLVAEIKMKSLNGALKNVAVTDLLPTGLEIENPRLSTSSSLTWIKQNIEPDYLDIRDDRINIFFTVPEEEKAYYYTTRAVTAGNFKVPSIHGEAMYNPDIYSKADSGQLRIIPMKNN